MRSHHTQVNASTLTQDESPAHGIIREWLESLGVRGRIVLFDAMVKDDLALTLALSGMSSELERVHRFMLLLLARAAAHAGLTPGELALLMTSPERELIEALDLLAGDHRRAASVPLNESNEMRSGSVGEL